MKKITEYLIEKIIHLKLELENLKNDKRKIYNENEANKVIIQNLKLELTNLRLILNNNKKE